MKQRWIPRIEFCRRDRFRDGSKECRWHIYLRRLVINFGASFLHCYGNVAWQVEFTLVRAKPLTAFRWGRHDKYLRVLYLDTKLTWSPLRAGSLIPWQRFSFSSRYEVANTSRHRPFGSTKSGNFLNWWATTSFSRTLITKTASYLVVHMSRFRRLVAAEAPVQSQGSPGGIYGGRSGTGTGFAYSVSVLSRQHRSTDTRIQSYVNRRVAAVPRDLSLTQTFTIDPQQRHYR